MVRRTRTSSGSSSQGSPNSNLWFDLRFEGLERTSNELVRDSRIELFNEKVRSVHAHSNSFSLKFVRFIELVRVIIQLVRT